VTGQPETLLLASGLSVLKPNSFSRQLELLRRFLETAGFRAILAGRAPGHAPRFSATGVPPDRLPAPRPGRLRTPVRSGPQFPPAADVFDVPVFSSDALEPIIRRHAISRIILLGYPDQFPFLLDGLRIPVYLWYQCSHPGAPPGIESTVVVPLTAMTAGHVKGARFPAVGPVIPHGVDTEIFYPGAGAPGENGGAPPADAPHGYRKTAPVLLTVGANSARKRFDKLLEAFRIVLAELPEATFRIKTDSENKPGGFDLQALAACDIPAGRVSVITAELSDAELASLYASADIYVHAAEWEGFCIPVIEAMACGLPVVTHPVQGPGELVPYPELLVPGSKKAKDGDVELLMADPVSFARAIVRFCSSPELAASASAAGRRAAVEKYDIRVVAEMWARLLRS